MKSLHSLTNGYWTALVTMKMVKCLLRFRDSNDLKTDVYEVWKKEMKTEECANNFNSSDLDEHSVWNDIFDSFENSKHIDLGIWFLNWT